MLTDGGGSKSLGASAAGILDAKIRRHAWIESADKATEVEYPEEMKFDGNETALRAKSRISTGFGAYSPLAGVGNNCENFARWCATGRDESLQAQREVARKFQQGGAVATAAATVAIGDAAIDFGVSSPDGIVSAMADGVDSIAGGAFGAAIDGIDEMPEEVAILLGGAAVLAGAAVAAMYVPIKHSGQVPAGDDAFFVDVPVGASCSTEALKPIGISHMKCAQTPTSTNSCSTTRSCSRTPRMIRLRSTTPKIHVTCTSSQRFGKEVTRSGTAILRAELVTPPSSGWLVSEA